MESYFSTGLFIYITIFLDTVYPSSRIRMHKLAVHIYSHACCVAGCAVGTIVVVTYSIYRACIDIMQYSQQHYTSPLRLPEPAITATYIYILSTYRRQGWMIRFSRRYSYITLASKSQLKVSFSQLQKHKGYMPGRSVFIPEVSASSMHAQQLLYYMLHACECKCMQGSFYPGLTESKFREYVATLASEWSPNSGIAN